MDEVQWTPQTVTAAVLDLAGDLAEHLRSSDGRARRGGVAGRRGGPVAGPDPRRGAPGHRVAADQGAAAAARRPLRRGQAGARGARPRGPGQRSRRRSPCATRRWAPPSGPATRWCCSMSTRTPATPSSCCCTPSSATGTRSPRSATRASRSTAGAARARATCAGSPVTSRPGPAARPRSGSSPPASATPAACSTRPPCCRWSCGRRRRTSRCSSPRPTGAAGARCAPRCCRR